MPKASKRKLQSRRANQISVNKRKVTQREKSIGDINQVLTQINDEALKSIYQSIVETSNGKEVNQNTHRQRLINIIEQLPDNELKSAIHLLNEMRYSNGPDKGNLFSSFLQKKALNFINSSLYKTGQNPDLLIQNNKTLQKKINQLEDLNSKKDYKVRQLIGTLSQYKRKQKLYISRVRASARKPPHLDSRNLKASIQSMILKNKSQYTTQFINMATQVSQIGQISFRSTVQATQLILGFLTGESSPLSITYQSVIQWNKEISELHTNQILNQNCASTFFTIGIMVDESTRGQQKIFLLCVIFWNSTKNKPDFQLLEMKDLANCTGKSVAQAIYDTLNYFNINLQQCLTCVSDNTNYMSGKSGGAIALFNEISNGKLFRVPCGIHVAHIIMNNFEEVTFGKLSSISGFSQKALPANLLYLIWDLHDGYNKSDKDKPMGVRSDYIRMLYEERLKYKLTKYQQPIRSRWLYELICAEQYLERRDIHIEFTKWFLPCLKARSNTPKSYIKNSLGKDFYYPMYKFLTGFDPELQITMQDSAPINLPPGRRAHQMPDFVARTIIKLQTIVEDPYSFFGEELLESINLLEDHQFDKLVLDLERGTQKALELHQKWLNCWLHLPLSICRLGGKYGREFARSFARIVLGTPCLSVPTLRELCYMKFLELDFKCDKVNDFGLLDALHDSEFNSEFQQFIQEEQKPLNQFPKIFEFVKYRIWYIIVHQQQLEGLFNKWDLKTHPKMTSNVQKSKLRLSNMPLTEISCNSSDLVELRAEKRKQQIESTSKRCQETINNDDCEKNANILFGKLFGRK